MRINVRAAGVALAAAVGIMLLGGVAHADTNAHNNGLINTGNVNALNVQACNSPVTVIGASVNALSPQSVDECVNSGGQVGGSKGNTNVGNNGAVNTGDIDAGNIQLCNSALTGIGAHADIATTDDVGDCVNSGGSVGATQGDTNTWNNGLIANTGDINAANVQACNSDVTGIGLSADALAPSTVKNCVNAGGNVVNGGTSYKADAKPAVKAHVVKAVKPAKATKVAKVAKAAKVAKVKPAKVAKVKHVHVKPAKAKHAKKSHTSKH